ncbi:MAG TPA: ABC transporter substrate-binding protein, partial [Stellaceae bacterium]|nr:ABC transporter substrate-binding protein [Stellaceae bacterium]
MRWGLAFIAAFFLTAVFPRSGAEAATKVVMLYNATSAYSASYVAKEEGYFDKHGLDFEFSLTTNTTMTPAALMSGTVQLGGITPPMILQANEQGLDLVVVAGGTAAPDPAGTSGMLARTGSGIKAAPDLVGRKIGVPGLGGTFDILAKKWVQSKGVDFR